MLFLEFDVKTGSKREPCKVSTMGARENIIRALPSRNAGCGNAVVRDDSKQVLVLTIDFVEITKTLKKCEIQTWALKLGIVLSWKKVHL